MPIEIPLIEKLDICPDCDNGVIFDSNENIFTCLVCPFYYKETDK